MEDTLQDALKAQSSILCTEHKLWWTPELHIQRRWPWESSFGRVLSSKVYNSLADCMVIHLLQLSKMVSDFDSKGSCSCNSTVHNSDVIAYLQYSFIIVLIPTVVVVAS